MTLQRVWITYWSAPKPLKYLRPRGSRKDSIFLMLVLACQARVFFPTVFLWKHWSTCFSNNVPWLLFYVHGSLPIFWNHVFTFVHLLLHNLHNLLLVTHLPLWWPFSSPRSLWMCVSSALDCSSQWTVQGQQSDAHLLFFLHFPYSNCIL